MNYTVINRHGVVQIEGASLADAAAEVLGYDGNEYEVRPADGGGFELWVSRFSRNSTCYNGLTRSVIYSIEDDREAAEANIFKQVIERAEIFEGCDVMTDEAYKTMLADLAAEESE